jgi:hypothetical protein
MRTPARFRISLASAALLATLAVLSACTATPTINSPIGAATASGSATPGVPANASAGTTSAAPAPTTPGPRPDPAPNPALPSGITGVDGFTMTIRCPVMPESGCPPTPVSARLSVTSPAGATVATATSDKKGHFRIALLPGTYTLFARSLTGGIPRPASVKLTVVAGRLVTVRLTLDSGIR